MRIGPTAFLNDLFRAAVASARPDLVLAAHLPPALAGRTVVVGAGKSAAAMARALEEAWQGVASGVVVVPYGHAVPCASIEVLEAAHPVPDARGVEASRRILDAVRGLGPDDLVICLLSGGGSAVLTLPADGVTLEEKRRINQSLLRSGASIAEMNCVRKHLSAIKGGRLALACAPARLATLAISDVPGDDISIIASGPTVPDASTCGDALGVLDRRGVPVSGALRASLERGALETPKAEDFAALDSETRLIATPGAALDAAASCARDHGVVPVVVGDAVEGEAREVARDHARMALDIARDRRPADPPTVILSGGEVTVTVRGDGKGGPNTEFLLAMAIALDRAPGIYAIACDTDGIDGAGDNAGAVIGPDTLSRAESLGMAPEAFLRRNDAYGFFARLGDLVKPGPTLTNVNDFRAVLVTGAETGGAERRPDLSGGRR